MFLPQVPTEEGWSRNTFLEQLGVKAGLPTQTWKDPDADIFLFTAFVFNDQGGTKDAESDEDSHPKPPTPPTPQGPGSTRP